MILQICRSNQSKDLKKYCCVKFINPPKDKMVISTTHLLQDCGQRKKSQRFQKVSDSPTFDSEKLVFQKHSTFQPVQLLGTDGNNYNFLSRTISLIYVLHFIGNLTI